MQTICREAEDHNQKIECWWQKHLHRINKTNVLASDSQTGQKESYSDSDSPSWEKKTDRIHSTAFDR